MYILIVEKVFKWCYDIYDGIISTGEFSNPTGGRDLGTKRVNRGGSYVHPKIHCGTSTRNYAEQSNFCNDTGFRLVRSCPKQ